MHSKPYGLEDILLGIVYFFPEGNKQFVHVGKDMKMFFERQKLNYPELLDSFMKGGMEPIVEQLKKAYIYLGGIGQSRGTGMEQNPITFSQSSYMYFEDNIEKKFTEDELEQLEKLSKSFYRKFKC